MLAPLNNSVVFKKLFRDPEVLTAFVKDLAAVELEIDASHVELEKRFPPAIGHIDIAMDIFVDDPKHRVVVEIQRVRYDYHFQRFWHYHQVATIELAKSYQSYLLDRSVYTIVWLTAKSSDPLYQNSLITTSICSENEKGEKLEIYSHKLYFLNPYYLNDHTPEGVRDWVELVLQSIVNPRQPKLHSQREILVKAQSLIQEEDLTPQERAKIMEETAAEEHLRIKHQEGFDEGKEEGRKERDIEIARKMLAKGFPAEEIADWTDLSVEEIAALSK